MCGIPLTSGWAGRERRYISVMFIDLVGFSSFARTLETEELRDLADAVVTASAQIVKEYDGRVDSMKGDGLVAIFGAPRSHPDDAERAVRAAWTSLSAIRQIGIDRGLKLEGRAGVNTGLAVAGELGSGDAGRYTVMGNTVNVAARLEEAAGPGQLLVGEETFQATHHSFRFEPLLHLELKGVQAPAKAYKYLSALPDGDADPYAEVPLLGREREMAALDGAYAAVIDSAGPVQRWIAGPAGSGKTRLLNDFLEALGDAPKVVPLRLLPTGKISWRDLEAPVFGTLGSDRDSARRQRVSQRLEELLPDEPRWRSAILASLDLTESKTWRLLDRRMLNRTNLAWRDLLAALARAHSQSGLIVTLDSEIAAEDTSDFLTMLGDASAPILILRTTRDNRPKDSGVTIPLDPLTVAHRLALIDGISSPALRPATDVLVRQVGGLPADVLELGRALWRSVPGTFSQSFGTLLQSNLDMLDPPARLLFAHAALAESNVWGGLLATLCDADYVHLTRILVDRGLLLVRGTSTIDFQVEYEFKSALLRKAAAGMVPISERPYLHLQIATWLETYAPPIYSGLVGRQFELGGSPDAAIPHYLVAADIAAKESDFEQVKDLFARALGLPANPVTLARTALSYATTAVTFGERSLATSLLEQARELIHISDDEFHDELGAQERVVRDRVASIS